MPECVECGVGDRGAFLVEVDGDHYCQDDVPERPCERCGAATTSVAITGEHRCDWCQEQGGQSGQRTDTNQSGLGDW